MSYKKEFMLRAIQLAQKGEGFVNPNPLVGCLLVRDGQVLAEGYHHRFGAPHAERDAVSQCLAKGLSPEGAEAYVTLEPCCHHGKQPPCTDLLIQHHIAKVFVGMLDPNPLVAGQGIEKLRQAGIEVEVGFEQDRIAQQNQAFLTLFTQHRPFVLMKTAMTLDGKIATASGDSRWVTSAPARNYVHQLRHRLMAIMVGIGTVLQDDPMLNCRLDGRDEVAQPYRIVVDSHARVPINSKLVQSAAELPLIVAHDSEADNRKLDQLRSLGVETLCCPAGIDIPAMLSLLAKPTASRPAIDSILLEGGAALNAAFLREGLVDEINLFVAPKIVGGQSAPSPVASLGIDRMADALPFRLVQSHMFPPDILLRFQK